MKTKLLLVLIISLGMLSSGCQIIPRSPFRQAESIIDPELMPYYEKFVEIREELGFVTPLPHINIIFDQPNSGNEGTVGECGYERWNDGERTYTYLRTVRIKPEYYDTLMTRDGEGYHKGIERLVFHELVHCFWLVGHFEKEYSRVIKRSHSLYPSISVTEIVKCKDLMHPSASGSKGTDSYLCYTQHFDLYLEQLHAIMSITDPK